MTPTTVNLRDLLKAKGLTQLQLAELVGVRQATISDLESGKAKVIRLSLLESLTRELGVPLEQLIVITADDPKPIAKPSGRKRKGK